MRWGAALLLLLALGACGERDGREASPGAGLEAAARAQGLVVDPATATIAGAWGRDADRVCVAGPADGAQRIGVRVDYGEGQGCVARGSVRRRGDVLAIDLGRACRFDARFEGARIVFPADLPEACAAACRGRASMAALDVERLSGAASEATMLRDTAGRPLCEG